jgi:hypothetical protein
MLCSNHLKLAVTAVAVVSSTWSAFAAPAPQTFDSTDAELLLVAATGNDVPMLNVLPSCRAAAATQIAPSDRMQTCIMSEQRAREKLVKEWPNFSGTDRNTCVIAMMSFEPTYTELITCLEIAFEVRKSSTKQF